MLQEPSQTALIREVAERSLMSAIGSILTYSGTALKPVTVRSAQNDQAPRPQPFHAAGCLRSTALGYEATWIVNGLASSGGEIWPRQRLALGSCQQIALEQLDADRPKNLEFGCGLNSFGNAPNIQSIGDLQHAGNDRAPCSRSVNSTDQGHIEFQHVWLKVGKQP